MQTEYSKLKVNNEVELCEIADMECKRIVEKEFLQNRISYFVRWQKRGFLRRKETCIICVHDDVKDEAADIVQSVCDERGGKVRFLMKKPKNSYL